MKRLPVFIALGLLLSSVVFSQTTKVGKAEQELIDLVRQWDDAYVKRDAATLDHLLADEFTFVGGPDKSQYLAQIKSTPADYHVESAVSSDLKVQIYEDAAIITGIDTIKAVNKGQDIVSKWLYTDVWIKRSGRWQCVKTHASPKQ
jgi:ketosteroid isomerase-like protein